MDKQQIVMKILSLPRDFHERGNVSIIALLKDSGYIEISSLLSFQDILFALNKNPPIAKEWLIYSENQRSNKHWYFRQIDNKWEVNYWPSKGYEMQKVYDNFFEACAEYILLEVRSIAQYL